MFSSYRSILHLVISRIDLRKRRVKAHTCTLTVCRYLCRALYPSLYPADVVRATEVDALLDLAESLINASARNQKPALKQANQVLGKVRTAELLLLFYINSTSVGLVSKRY